MASNSKKRRRVLGASCILAALIIASSSFAWFTSSDEVTNRLTASADYGVTIAEDFTPPEKWVPGQTIEKNVGVVNTGNIDAFVRTWLEGEMNLLAEKRDKTTWDAENGQFTDQTPTAKNVLLNSTAVYTKDNSDSDNDGVTGLTKTTDDNLNKLGMTYSYTDGNATAGANTKVYLKELDTTIYQNPNDPTKAGTNPVGATPVGGFNEVMTVQAGGVLAYLKTGTAADGNYFYYKPNNSNTFKSSKGYTYEVDGDEQYQVVLAGSTNTFTQSGDDIEVKNNKIIVKDEDAIIKYLGNHIDSDNFYPATTGLYIFRRNSDKDADTVDPTISDYEFSGYYYVKSTTEAGIQDASGTGESAKTSAENTFAKQGKYFALQYENDNSQRSDYVLEKDTYMVIRDDDGNVTFKPSTKTNYKTVTGSDPVYYYDGTDYYNAKGEKLSGTEATAASTALSSSEEKSVTLFTAQEDVLENKDLKWNYYDTAAFCNQAAYYKDSGGSWYPVGSSTALNSANTDENDIITALNNNNTVKSPMYVVTDSTGKLKIDVALANIGTAAANSATDAEKWTRIAGARDGDGKYTGASDTFYYNNDVEEGATTSKLVDSVTMDSTITQYDFIAFDFDLNVFSDSIQVTLDSNGTEKTDTVSPWAADNGNGNTAGAASGAKGGTDTEIEYITWTTT